jgi:hypothetical protein
MIRIRINWAAASQPQARNKFRLWGNRNWALGRIKGMYQACISMAEGQQGLFTADERAILRATAANLLLILTWKKQNAAEIEELK